MFQQITADTDYAAFSFIVVNNIVFTRCCAELLRVLNARFHTIELWTLLAIVKPTEQGAIQSQTIAASS